MIHRGGQGDDFRVIAVTLDAPEQRAAHSHALHALREVLQSQTLTTQSQQRQDQQETGEAESKPQPSDR